jgi:hypothetical protein
MDEKKNLYRLNVGDAATIDQAYWELADELCCVRVHNVGAWAG